MVDCTGLENRSPFTGTEGSNPSLSAKLWIRTGKGSGNGSFPRRKVGKPWVSQRSPELYEGRRSKSLPLRHELRTAFEFMVSYKLQIAFEFMEISKRYFIVNRLLLKNKIEK